VELSRNPQNFPDREKTREKDKEKEKRQGVAA
jgi:hypothetical protein